MDFSDPGFIQDPYPLLAAYRGREPVTWSDPPTHTRLRAALARGFTPKAVRRHEPRIAEVADKLLDDLPVDRPVDLVRRYAEPLPLVMICELLGVPSEDRAAFVAWSAQLAPVVGFPQRDKLPGILRAADDYCGYLAEALRQRGDRDPNPHLGFGHGPHYRIGGPLARVEARIAIEKLVQRFPELRLTGEDHGYHNLFVARGRRSVPVHLRTPPTASRPSLQ